MKKATPKCRHFVKNYDCGFIAEWIPQQDGTEKFTILKYMPPPDYIEVDGKRHKVTGQFLGIPIVMVDKFSK